MPSRSISFAAGLALAAVACGGFYAEAEDANAGSKSGAGGIVVHNDGMAPVEFPPGFGVVIVHCQDEEASRKLDQIQAKLGIAQ